MKNSFKVWSKTFVGEHVCLFVRLPWCLEHVYGRGMEVSKCVRKLPVTLGKSVVFAGLSGFLHQLQLASHDVAAIWQKK